MRCLTLADELSLRGAEILFVCREHPGNLNAVAVERGYTIVSLPYVSRGSSGAGQIPAHASWLGAPWQEDAAETLTAVARFHPNWLVVDHYAIDHRWELLLRPHTGKLMVIDDLADRRHDCDLLLDQNLYLNMDSRYDGLLPDRCVRFLGPRYALLRREFVVARRNLRQRDGKVRRILVFFGGSDPTNETAKALEAVRRFGRPDILVDAVVGGGNPRRREIEDLCASMSAVRYHCQVSNMAELTAAADLAIGAGGSATWERCFLGLPAIVLIIAQNQYEATKAVSREGAVLELGDAALVSVELLAATISTAIQNSAHLKAMGEKALLLMGDDLINGRFPLVAAIEEGVGA